jgi:hypothetical protein
MRYRRSCGIDMDKKIITVCRLIQELGPKEVGLSQGDGALIGVSDIGRLAKLIRSFEKAAWPVPSRLLGQVAESKTPRGSRTRSRTRQGRYKSRFPRSPWRFLRSLPQARAVIWRKQAEPTSRASSGGGIGSARLPTVSSKLSKRDACGSCQN